MDPVLDTPWGPADSVVDLAPGLLAVTTPSHGGLLVTRAFAATHLSPVAIARGAPWGEFLAYEEDCDWYIVAWECPAFRPRLFESAPPEARDDPAAYLLRALSAWHADYLIERGVCPDVDGFRFWRETHLGRSAAARAVPQ